MAIGNYAFIDGANLHQGVTQLGWKLDYQRFRIFLRDKYRVEVAYFFIGFVPLQSALYQNLQKWGYVAVFKPTLELSDGRVKGNCDADLVLQAMIDLPTYDRAVIVTGDGDFVSLVAHLEKSGKLEQIVSPNSKNCSRLLKETVPKKHIFLDRAQDKLGLRA